MRAEILRSGRRRYESAVTPMQRASTLKNRKRRKGIRKKKKKRKIGFDSK